jgi:hypothetical protein
MLRTSKRFTTEGTDTDGDRGRETATARGRLIAAASRRRGEHIGGCGSGREGLCGRSGRIVVAAGFASA